MDRRIKIAKPGAILRARSHSRPRTTTDARRAPTAVLGVQADPPGQPGHLVETYRSEGRTATNAAQIAAGGWYLRH
jgi:hypothetical protein